MGTFTFHFDSDRKVWECFGNKETGAEIFEISSDVKIIRGSNVPTNYEEVCRSGMESGKSITITLQPIMAKGGRGQTNKLLLPKGKYQLNLLMLDPGSNAPGKRIFDVTIRTQKNYEWFILKKDRIDIFKQTGRVNSILVRHYPVKFQEPGSVNVTLKPVTGKVVLCGAILEPEP